MQKLFKGSRIVGAKFPIVLAQLGSFRQEISSFQTSFADDEDLPVTMRRMTLTVSPLLLTGAGSGCLSGEPSALLQQVVRLHASQDACIAAQGCKLRVWLCRAPPLAKAQQTAHQWQARIAPPQTTCTL